MSISPPYTIIDSDTGRAALETKCNGNFADLYARLPDGTIIGTSDTQTLTNKTLTTPVIASFYQDAGKTQLMTIPNTANDTLVTLAASQVLNNKTLTTPVINGAITGTITPPLTFYGTNFNPHQGFLINGKIVPSVSSNNLNIAIKTLAGTDPSASNPVYIRIGDTIRAITAALSITKNGGTNWCNSGSSELATKEIDYFVYLGYNATDGVVIGFSRIPGATCYGDFSSTTSDEKYCAISTITNAVATDYYEAVGRFAATLSAGAGYTWSVPTYTAINLIQRPIYETRTLSFAPTITGFSGSPTVTTSYKLLSNRMVLDITISGTSNSTGFTFTLPFKSLILASYAGLGTDNTTTSGPTLVQLAAGSNIVTEYYNLSGSWTASGTKAGGIFGVAIQY